jgi:hypothetical protein
MNLSGYVQLRRGLLEHTMSGKLSTLEYAVLTALITLADSGTGADHINAPVLRSFLPGLSTDAAKRILSRLEEGGYIFRKITPRSVYAYPYVVNKYMPTRGPNKALQVDLSKALVSRDLNDICYVRVALEPPPHTDLEPAPHTDLEPSPHTAHYYYKENENDKDKPERHLPSIKGECESIHLASEFDVSTGIRSTAHTVEEGCESQANHISCASIADASLLARPAGAGLLQLGASRFVDIASGEPVLLSAAVERMSAMGLTYANDTFTDAQGAIVSSVEAKQAISGMLGAPGASGASAKVAA